MLEIMLCGASDTDRVRNEFVQVIEGFGASPLHYLSGDILHINSATATWDRNSTTTVRSADLCVFVIVERYGEITWTRELREALDIGKPFVVLCLADTYAKYLTLSRSIRDVAAISDPGERSLVSALTEIERDLNLTVVQFQYGLFAEVLRRQLGSLIQQALGMLADRNQRAALRLLLDNPGRLSPRQLAAVKEIALDEFEQKNLRKAAVSALAERSACDDDTLLALLRSPEQGVQRLATARLFQLYTTRPIDRDFIEEVVCLVSQSDDVGLTRRLIPTLFAADANIAVQALESLELNEVGTRRRIALALEEHESEFAASLLPNVLGLARRCEDGAVSADWKDRLRALIGRLAANTAAT